MQTKPLGNSDLLITPLGVGAWAMGGGGWAFAWGPQDDNDSIAAIREAVDRESTGSIRRLFMGSAIRKKSRAAR